MAIALSGGGPDYGADRLAGQSRLGIFRRQRDGFPPEHAPSTQNHDGRPGGSLDALATCSVAQPDCIGAAQNGIRGPAPAADFDVRLVKESFAHMTSNAALAMEYFYSHLFISSPETRAMFPMGMSQMRERLFAALTRLVWIMDSSAEFEAYVAQLGRDHRKYGVTDKHFHAFFTALLETAEYFGGSDWTPETADAWREALEHAARMMRSAAAADAKDHPPWWIGEIVAHDRRAETIAVLTIRPDKPLPYQPGQYLSVQVPRWPRVWRPYSIANAPRTDGLIDLHVRAVPGGMVSTALVRHAAPGDTVILGPPRGELAVPDTDRDLLCVAGGTGLAPIKALIEDVISRQGTGKPREILLFAGARQRQDLYDLPDLQALQRVYPGLQIIPVLSDEPAVADEPLLMTGLIPDALSKHGQLENFDACICGPEAMVRQTALVLATHLAPEQIHHDPLPAEHSFAAQPTNPGHPDEFCHSALYAKFARPGFPPEEFT